MCVESRNVRRDLPDAFSHHNDVRKYEYKIMTFGGIIGVRDERVRAIRNSKYECEKSESGE